jgi:hypothetical protein
VARAQTVAVARMQAVAVARMQAVAEIRRRRRRYIVAVVWAEVVRTQAQLWPEHMQ